MAIRKTKHGTYEVKIYLGRDPATGKERHRYKRFPTKQQAKQFEAEARRQVEDRGHRPPSDATVAEHLRDWLETEALPNVKPRTLKRYEELVRLHIAPAIGRIRVDRLTARDVSALLAAKKGKVAERTRLHIYRVLHRALVVAVRWGVAARNVCDAVTPPKPGEPELQVLEPHHVEALLRSARGHRLYPFFLTAVMTGMRMGELCGIRRQDVDLDAGVATVARTLERAGLNPVFGTPKNGRSRLVPLTSEVVAALRDRLREQERERAFFGQEYADHGLVFAQPNGRPLDPHSIARWHWRRLREAAGLSEGVRFHDLRHTFVSRTLQAGANPRAVSEIAGHHDAGFTLKRYAHVSLTDTREAVHQLQDYLREKRSDNPVSPQPQPH